MHWCHCIINLESSLFGSALCFSNSSVWIRLVLMWSRTVSNDQTNISYTSQTITSRPSHYLDLGQCFVCLLHLNCSWGLKTISHCWSFVVLPKNFFGTKSSALLHVSHSPCQHILFCSGSYNTSFQNELRWKEVDLDRSIVMILEVMPEWLCCFVFIHF